MRLARAVSTVLLILMLSAATAVQADDESSANRLFVGSVQLMKQYEGIPSDDPAQYEARLNLLREVRDNLASIVEDYPGSSLAVEIVTEEKAKTLVIADIEAEIIRLEQSIPAAVLMAETYPLWDQYRALPTDEVSQYGARLELLKLIAANLDTLENQYLLSYEHARLRIDAQEVQREIPRLEQSIPAAVLMAETYPLWDQYRALPTDEVSQYGARLELLKLIAANLDTLEDQYPLSYERALLRIDAQEVQKGAETLACLLDFTNCILNTLLNAAQSIEFKYSRAQALAAVAQAQASAGDVAGAINTAQSIEVEELSAEALAKIAQAQASAGDVAGARKTVRMALNAAQSIESEVQRAEALAEIAQAQASAGDVAGALQTVRKALETAQSIEIEVWRDVALAAVAQAQASAGDVAGAKATAHSIELKGWRAPVLAEIAQAQASAGDVTGANETARAALETAQSIEFLYSRAEALTAVAETQASVGDFVGARQTVLMALENAQSIENEFLRAVVLAAAAQAQASSGDVAGARQTVLLALEASQSIVEFGRWRTAEVLVAIAEAQTSAGDVAGAINAAQSIEDDLWRAGALVLVAEAVATLK